MASNHIAASTCRGKFFDPLGAGLGISFSQTRASHNKPNGVGRERAAFWYKTIYVASHCLQKLSSVNIDHMSFVLNFGISQGLFGHFHTLAGFSRHFMCIIQI